jgi:hypothetical protein
MDGVRKRPPTGRTALPAPTKTAPCMARAATALPLFGSGPRYFPPPSIIPTGAPSTSASTFSTPSPLVDSIPSLCPFCEVGKRRRPEPEAVAQTGLCCFCYRPRDMAGFQPPCFTDSPTARQPDSCTELRCVTDIEAEAVLNRACFAITCTHDRCCDSMTMYELDALTSRGFQRK